MSYASNILYSGGCASLADALYLYEQEHRQEARAMRAICEADDDFPNELIACAEQIAAIRAEYNKALAELHQKFIEQWRASGDSRLQTIADAAESEDWTVLAI